MGSNIAWFWVLFPFLVCMVWASRLLDALICFSKLINGKHCVKFVRIRRYSGPHFPTFGLNTERYRLSLRIQSECGEMRTRITPNMDAFYTVKPVNHRWWSFFASIWSLSLLHSIFSSFLTFSLFFFLLFFFYNYLSSGKKHCISNL